MTSLDGLRGLAAVVVLVHHAFLLIPALAAPYYGHPEEAGALWWLVRSPLHIFWSGTEAVYLFFVLSGLVLGLSVRSRGFTWSAYFPARLTRLYLPVVAAVLLALVSISLVARDSVEPSAWLNARPDGYSPSGVIQDVTLVGGVSRTISPLWSLQWEVVFSLLLPVYIVIARRASLWVQISAAIALSTIGSAFGVGLLFYLPMFAIGTALAGRWDEVSAWCERLSTVVWVVVLIAAFAAMVSSWLVLDVMPMTLARTAMLPVTLLGIAAIVLAAAHFKPIGSVLASPPFAWLGAISFSLYLVHEPLIVASGFLFDRPAIAIAVAIPVSFLVAWAFYISVERPSHRLSRWIRSAAPVLPSETAAHREVETEPAAEKWGVDRLRRSRAVNPIPDPGSH